MQINIIIKTKHEGAQGLYRPSRLVCLGRKGRPRSELAPTTNVLALNVHVKSYFQFQGCIYIHWRRKRGGGGGGGGARGECAPPLF